MDDAAQIPPKRLKLPSESQPSPNVLRILTNIKDGHFKRDYTGPTLEFKSYQRGASLALAQVLDDVGLSDTGRWRRAACTLQHEALQNVTSICVEEANIVAYRFGSRSEGTTTFGLHSDADVLACDDSVHLLPDESHTFLHGIPNHLLLQSESFPGYVKLQLVGMDDDDGHIIPLCKDVFQIGKEHMYVYDMKERVVLPNNYMKQGLTEDFDEMNGPALSRNKTEVEVPLDYVIAHRCRLYHRSLDEWFQRQRSHGWPNEEVIEKVKKAEYFVVPIGHPFDDERHLLWRLSFSVAERILMQRLNIVQVQCYVLMKIVLKELVKPHVESAPSSYHCKMILLYMAEQTPSCIWRAENLLRCFQQYLYRLICAIEQGSCPHYLLKNRNMFFGKMKGKNKVELLKILKGLLSDEGRCFLRLECDSIGTAVSQQHSEMYQNGIRSTIRENSSDETHLIYTSFLVDALATYRIELFEYLAAGHDQQASLTRHKRVLQRLEQWPLGQTTESVMQRQAANWLAPFVRNSLGSLLVSLAKKEQRDHHLFVEAEDLLKGSLDSDMTSSRLKLAATYVDYGRYDDANSVLGDVDKLLHAPHERACKCYKVKRDFTKYSRGLSHRFSTELLLQRSASFCVVFLPHEVNMVPYPLKFEMYRAYGEESKEASNPRNTWFQWVAIDSSSFLYYLKYLLKRKIEDFMEKEIGLDDEPNLGHMETAKNIIASDMIRKGEYEIALHYLWESFQKRPHNNAAKWHMGVLLNKMLNSSGRP